MFYIHYRTLTRVASLILLVLAGQTAIAAESEEFLELTWDDLRPKETVLWRAPISDYTDEELQQLSDDELQRLILEQKQILHSVAVVHELNNKQISMPGLVVPLEYEDENIKEFLLVPYHGACIHVPPPPLYQIVLVTAEPAFKIEKLFDSVKITGKLETKLSTTPIEGYDEQIDVGYIMKNAKVEKYIEL